MPSESEQVVLDALVVGAGFSGVYILHNLRKNGFSVKLYEAADGLGGTWRLNCYPGARVDSDVPIYQYTELALVSGFDWKERFPGFSEIRRYFNHVDAKVNLSRDISFNTRVTSAAFDLATNTWLVRTDTGLATRARHLFLCTGFASKRYTPAFPGLESFRGQTYHSNTWPEGGVDLKGKKVAIIGTGASGVQIIQEIGPIVSHLTVYQRTPNYAIPMQQVSLDNPGTTDWKFPKEHEYPAIFEFNKKTYGGLVTGLDFLETSALDATPEERRAHYEFLYMRGGFAFWLATYKDILFNKEANDTAYDFWAEKTRARLTNPKMRDLLAPLTPIHAWGIKRPCLEQHYYEVYNQDNVDLIDVSDRAGGSPIVEITPTGVRTEKEGVVDVDVLILATGFDSITGGILNIPITNGEGVTLQEKWKEGTSSFLGMTTAGFPNMYWTYGPQGPCAFSNGPTCAECQGEWLVELLVRMRAENKQRADPTPEAEAKYTKDVRDRWSSSLFPGAKSWYQGCNIPGKPIEALNYIGGFPNYQKLLDACSKNGYEGLALA